LLQCSDDKWWPMTYLALLLPASVLLGANSLTITDKSGAGQTNYPVQIARPFLAGEIADCPQVVVSGTPVTTQADVKQRWSNNTVKHAILAFVVSTISANGSVSITFQNQSCSNTPLTKTQMLDAVYNFDAAMEFTNGSTDTASARVMLTADHYVLWTSGQVAQTIILADHSSSRAYDVGFDANNSIRPIFHATFWPNINKVRIRYIAEIANTEVLQDQVYSLVLKIANSSPTTVYTKTSFTHYARSRWTKEFWIGGAPSSLVNIDHNLDYLRQTGFFPNYDITKVVSEAKLASEYTAWLAAAKDLYDAGQWLKAMGTGGGRPDIGPYPAWTVRWLYTGDYRMREQSFGNADLAGAWPVHYREGDSAKFFDRNSSVQGIGRVMVVSTRPSFMGQNLSYSFTTEADKVTPVGTVTDGGWVPDIPHLPETWSPHYILSGDFWYLEQAWFWTSFCPSFLNGAATAYSYGRGPTGAEAGLQGQIRGMAWDLRTRVNTAYVTPDGTAEKDLFGLWVNDAIALQEGAWNITTTSFNGTTVWNWGRNTRSTGTDETTGAAYPVLNQFRRGSAAFAQAGYGIDDTVVKEAISNFEQHFMLFALGRAKELGYLTQALLARLAVHYIGVLTDSNFNPYIISNGRMPTIRLSDSQYFDTWAALKASYQSSWQTKTSFTTTELDDTEHSYAYIGLAAVSYIAGETGGQAAWDFMSTNVLTATQLNDNPKWAVTARQGLVVKRTAVSGKATIGGKATIQ
jgi:hypothetical protein